MCTATWLRQPGGYHLFHNRDELRTRLPALPPRIHVYEAIRSLAPIDANAGGTWIGVNEFKLAACLLNRYDPITQPGPFTSRGQLILHALATRHMDGAIERIRALPLHHFQPFTLALLFPDMPVHVLEWNGNDLNLIDDADAYLPLVSSSYDRTRASQVRQAAYTALPQPHTPQLLRQYHTSHSKNGPDALSVCMARADACTVSFTHIAVSPAEIKLTYHPGPPCEPASDITLTLKPLF